jgi:hypothetical protein
MRCFTPFPNESRYIVKIFVVDDSGDVLKPLNSFDYSWEVLSGSVRVAETSKKVKNLTYQLPTHQGVMLCTVTAPSDCDLKSKDTLTRLSCTNMVLSRWKPTEGT